VKIVRFGSVISLFCISLYASSFSVGVSNTTLKQGEILSISFIASGSDVKFPSINSISGYKILEQSSSKSMTITNGSMKKKITKKYRVIPTKSFVIPSYQATIDGKTYKSKEIKIVVSNKKNIKQKETDLIFALSLDKNHVVVGEAMVMTLQFKQKIGIDVYEINPSGIDYGGLIAKQITKEKKVTTKEYIIREIKYMLFAPKSGYFTIAPTFIDVTLPSQSNSFFGFGGQNIKRVYSNRLDISASKNPSSNKLAGDFTIKASATKNNSGSGDVVNLKLSIEGSGSVEHLDEFGLVIDGVTIYKQKAKKNISIIDDFITSKYEQDFVLLANGDIVIPPFKLTFFDTKSQTLKTIETKEIKIKITPNKGLKSTIEKKDSKNSQVDNIISPDRYSKILLIGLGFIGGIFATLFYMFIIKKNYHTLFSKLNRSDRDILKDILPFVGKSKDIDDVVLHLEENIYKNAKNKINKKVLKNIYKEFIDKNNNDKKYTN
jgi:hypothetical protein